MVWKPHVTVAAIAERDGRFLLVEERTSEGRVYNQPAGHLEEGESLLDAVCRETLEETAWRFVPEAVCGIYLWRHEATAQTFLRVSFCGHVDHHQPDQPLDDGILATHWLTPAELRQHRQWLRSPLVLRSLEDYLAGARYPLGVLSHIESGQAP